MPKSLLLQISYRYFQCFPSLILIRPREKFHVYSHCNIFTAIHVLAVLENWFLHLDAIFGYEVISFFAFFSISPKHTPPATPGASTTGPSVLKIQHPAHISEAPPSYESHYINFQQQLSPSRVAPEPPSKTQQATSWNNRPLAVPSAPLSSTKNTMTPSCMTNRRKWTLWTLPYHVSIPCH